MLDLQKYAKRAEADPEFRAKLLKNANQAIKDEFGEDLPYALKCKEKLSFEVESMDGLNDGNFEGVAGGAIPRKTIPQGCVHFTPSKFPLNSTFGSNYISHKAGILNDEDLEDVAGGTTVNLIPLKLWEQNIEDAGYTLSTQLRKNGTGFYKYYSYDNNGIRHSKDVKLVKVNGEWYAQVD